MWKWGTGDKLKGRGEFFQVRSVEWQNQVRFYRTQCRTWDLSWTQGWRNEQELVGEVPWDAPILSSLLVQSGLVEWTVFRVFSFFPSGSQVWALHFTGVVAWWYEYLQPHSSDFHYFSLLFHKTTKCIMKVSPTSFRMISSTVAVGLFERLSI